MSFLVDDQSVGSRASSGQRVSVEFAALSEIVQNLQHIDRQLAALQACRIDLLAAAEGWAADAAEAGVVGGDSRRQRVEYAHRTVVAEISAALRESERSTGRKLSQAHGIAALPATRVALHAGSISLIHASVIAETCDSVPQCARAELEAALLPLATAKTPGILARKARALRARMHPEPIQERHRAARAERHVSYEADIDGMAWLHLFAPAPEIIREYETLTGLGTRMQHPDEPRTLNQLRADILGELILHGSIEQKLRRIDPDHETDAGTTTGRKSKTARGSARPRVLVTVPVLTLLGRSEEPGILDGYGPIDPQTARELAAEAPGFHRLLTHPVTGAVLALDRTTYRVPADLRRWIQTRDGTCRAPGCNRSAQRTDIDHTIAWYDNGATHGTNLACLCRRDHVKKHRLGWKVTQDDSARLTWTSPTGRRYTTEPELAVGGPPRPGHRPPPNGDPPLREPGRPASDSDVPAPF